MYRPHGWFFEAANCCIAVVDPYYQLSMLDNVLRVVGERSAAGEWALKYGYTRLAKEVY